MLKSAKPGKRLGPTRGAFFLSPWHLAFATSSFFSPGSVPPLDLLRSRVFPVYIGEFVPGGGLSQHSHFFMVHACLHGKKFASVVG